MILNNSVTHIQVYGFFAVMQDAIRLRNLG